jgi:hypothetical protein
MANQMIALQTRNPQLPDPSRGAAQFANMMNMAAQQRTSQLQAERTRQEMEFAQAENARAEKTQAANMREKDVDFQVKDMKRLRNIGVAVLESGNEEAYQSWLGMVDQSDKQFGDTIRQVAPTFNAKVLQTVLMEADKYIDKSVATPVASLEVDVAGNPRSVTVGGLNPQQSPVFDAPPPMATAPRATPTAPQAAPANPMAPGYKPNTAAADPGSLSLVINSALETGVMAKADFDKMLSIAPPESRAKIAAWVQQNNIQVAPDVPGVTDNQMRGAPNEMRASPMSYDGQTPESQFAVYRGQPMQSQTAGLSGAPEMQQTLAQTQPRTITKLQRRDPNVSPLPGSSQVPLERVRAEAAVQRETPAEAAAKAAATARATANVDTEKKAAEKLPGRNQVSTLIKKVRAAYEQLDKANAIPSERRGGFANAMDYVASSSLGREAQKMVGTKSSKYLSEIINSRKLLATAIKNATGMSAQEMNSNVELQLTLDALTDPTQGIEAARTTLDTLEELYGAPSAAPAKTKTKQKTSTSTLSAATRAKYGL